MYSGNYSTGERKGEWFQLYSIGFGGIPGRPIGDGPDGHSLWPSFVNIPCEYLESYYPMRIERWETVADTGGAGVHRGGNGVDVTYRFLEPGTVAIHDDRWLTYPWGVNGGEPGARGRKWLERADGTHRGAAEQGARRAGRARATSCTSSPGAAAAGATRWPATPSSSRSRCGAAWSPRRAPGGYGVVVTTTARSTPPRRRRCGQSCRPRARPSCRCSTWVRRCRRSSSGARPRRGCRHRGPLLDVSGQPRLRRRAGLGPLPRRGRHRPGARLLHAGRRPRSRLPGMPGRRRAGRRVRPRRRPCPSCTPASPTPRAAPTAALFFRKVRGLRHFVGDDPLGEPMPEVAPLPGRGRRPQAVRQRLLRHVAGIDPDRAGHRHRRARRGQHQRVRARDGARRAAVAASGRSSCARPSATALPARTRPTCSTCRPSTPTSCPRPRSSPTSREDSADGQLPRPGAGRRTSAPRAARPGRAPARAGGL